MISLMTRGMLGLDRVLAHKKVINCMDLQYPFLATASKDETVKVWDVDRLSSHSAASSSGNFFSCPPEQGKLQQRLMAYEGKENRKWRQGGEKA